MPDTDDLIGTLRGTLGKLEMVLDTISEAIAWTGADGKVQWCNDAMAHLVGRPRLAVLGAALIDLLPLEQHGHVVTPQWHPVRLMFSGDSPVAGTYEFRQGDRQLHLDVTGTHMLPSPAEPKNAVFVIRDVTRRQQAEEVLQASEERFRLLVNEITDYAIFMLNPQGRVASWSLGAERTKGYKAEEIIGQPFEVFFTPEDRAAGKPIALLKLTIADGRAQDEGWRVRKDGSRFWADVILTAIYDGASQLRGFAKVTRDVTERRQHDEDIARLNESLGRQADDLLAVNRELEAFSYSVSHDLRAPLRAIDGYSRELLENLGDQLDARNQNDLHRIRAATVRMGQLIDDMLGLSRVGRAEMRHEDVPLHLLVEEILQELQAAHPDRHGEFVVASDAVVRGDPRLLKIALENLLGNAWKFTERRAVARIEFGVAAHGRQRAYFIKDNGAGFDMTYAGKLFGAFQRLHDTDEFPGTGIGLATVQRIIHRHGGAVWAESAVDDGATFYFTLPAVEPPERNVE